MSEPERASASPSAESLRAAMEAAWRDHHHARDQTWKSLTMEAYLAVGLVTMDAQFGSRGITLAAGCLVALAACFGARITLNHRGLERRKFIHIMNCEELLGLHRADVIPLTQDGQREFGVQPQQYSARQARAVDPNLANDSAVSTPRLLTSWSVFNLRINNTAAFILRMHVAIFLFAILLVVARFLAGSKSP